MTGVKIETFHYKENAYTKGDKKFKGIDLIEASKNLEVFDLPLSGIDIGVRPWDIPNIKTFCYHIRRVNDADLAFPIILDDTGYICDGWHRVTKAILLGHKTIKAKRLQIMPEAI